MKRYLLVLIASVAAAGILPSGRCQTATVTETAAISRSYTFSDASGFSIANNGTMLYDGPINQLHGSPCCISAVLTIDGQAAEFNHSNFEHDTGIDINLNEGNTLSHELINAQLQSNGSAPRIAIQYDVVIGGVTKAGASSSYTLQEKVDSQSLSIFPQFQPSVFP